MKRAIPFVLFVIAGLAAAVLRRFQLTGAFTDGGLLIPGQGVTAALIVLSAAAAAGAVLYSALCRPRTEEGIPAGAIRPGCAGLLVAGGFLVLLGGALSAMESLTPTLRIAGMVLAVLFVISGALLAVAAVRMKKDPAAAVGKLLLLPDFTCCLWLVLLYQRNAADPVLMDYIFQLFAVICILLGLYFVTGQTYRLRRSRRTVLFCLLAGYFSLLCMGDFLTGSMFLLLLGFLLYLLAHAGILTLGGKSRNEP